MTALDLTYTPATTLPEANQDLADALEITRLALEEAERRNSESAAPVARAEQLRDILSHVRAAAIRAAMLPDHEPLDIAAS